MVEQSQISLLLIAALITIILPIVIAIIWIVKTKSYVYPLFIGALIFLIFVIILESVMHSIVNAIFPIIFNNSILYIIYGCLAAAAFEEGGRYLSFKYIMKNANDKKNAVTYGIGHGGFEMISVVGMTLLSTLMFAMTLNSLGIEGMLDGVNDAQIVQMVNDMLVSIESYTVLDVVLSIVERISAIILHVSCSIFVFKAVKYKNISSFWMAFGFHILMNIPAAFYQQQIISNLIVVEIFVVIISIITAVYALKTYKKMDCE